MLVLKVGEPYPGTIPKSEHCRIDMSDAGLAMYLCYKKPSEKEIDEICRGELTVALTMLKSVIFFLAKFGSQPWIDMPYNYILSTDLTNLQKPEGTLGYALTICLIDISNGIVKANRLIGLPNKFSKEVYKAINEQKSASVTINQYDTDLSSLYTRYTTADLLRYAVIKQKCAQI